MQANPSEWQTFYAQVKRRTGLDFDLYRANQLQRRILSMAEHKDHADLEGFWNWINASQANVDWFLDRIAINVSELFRNPEKWRDLESHILPELLSRANNLKVWSAGCSYGAEAHSLAMLLHDKFPGNHKITGSDIDQEALAQAKRGEFSEGDVKSVPDPYKAKYLKKEGASWFATPEIKKYLTFKKQNLLADRFESGFDLIMCRNVVIYFTEEAKNQLYQKFFDSLKPGGILFVGSTERIFNADQIGFQTARPFFYQKPKIEDKQWRNAS